MRTVVVLLFSVMLAAAEGPNFDVRDARGKKAAGIIVEAGSPDRHGWFPIVFQKSKGDPVMVWPFDHSARLPDALDEPLLVIVVQRGDPKILQSARTIAALVAPVVLGLSTMDQAAKSVNITTPALVTAFSLLRGSSDGFEKGVGLVVTGKAVDAVPELARALRERERQLTPMPYEVYAAALVYGRALELNMKFDEAGVAFLTALKQRPGDSLAQKMRSEALVRAGKPEAASQ